MSSQGGAGQGGSVTRGTSRGERKSIHLINYQLTINLDNLIK